MTTGWESWTLMQFKSKSFTCRLNTDKLLCNTETRPRCCKMFFFIQKKSEYDLILFSCLQKPVNKLLVKKPFVYNFIYNCEVYR